jgi:hypothetical protein
LASELVFAQAAGKRAVGGTVVASKQSRSERK